MATKNLNKTLIEKIKIFPCLYDPQHPDFHNEEVLNDIWDTVGSSINISGIAAKQLFDVFKTQYLKESSRRDELAFLEPYIVKNSLQRKYQITQEGVVLDESTNGHSNKTQPVISAEVESEHSHDSPTIEDLDKHFPEESDERFLFSCGSILKRLSKRKKIIAKMKIQQILFELEFSD